MVERNADGGNSPKYASSIAGFTRCFAFFILTRNETENKLCK